MTVLGAIRALAPGVLVATLLIGATIPVSTASTQSGRQPPRKKVEKKTDEEKRSGTLDEQDRNLPPIPRSIRDEPPIKISTEVVNVDVNVVDKKSGRLITNLNEKNFEIYEDGVKQEITNFRTGEGPMTVVLLLDNGFHNRYFSNYFDPTFAQEIFRSAAVFVQRFVRPEDFVAVVTFSMKPKVVQDFTNDGNRLSGAILAAYRDLLNFSESNIYDAISFALLGGKAVQLYDEGEGPSEYVGLQEVEGHTAVILITTGIDTFSRLTYDKTLKIVAQAGVPIFTVGVGNLFYKKYEHLLGSSRSMDYQMAFLQLKTFAQRSGGAYYPMTFEGEIPSIMQSIEALLRNQYSLGYVPSNTRREGKERQIKLDVDVDGDGKSDQKRLDLRYRQRYLEPDDRPKK